MRPDRTFQSLLALAGGAAILLTVTATRYLRAGIPNIARAEPSARWHALILPGTGDLAIHLVSYCLLGLAAVAAMRAACLLARRARHTRVFLAGALAATTEPSATMRALAAHCGLAGRVDLVEWARPLACCYGLGRPRILLTTGLVELLTEVELEAVLRHERFHLRRCDPLRLLVADTLAAAFFFLPLIRMLRDCHAIAAEIAADRHASPDPRLTRGIAGALYKLLRYPGARAPRGVPGAATALPLRIAALVGGPVAQPRYLPSRAGFWSVVGALTLVGLLLAPLPLIGGVLTPLPAPLAALLALCRHT